MREKFEVRSEIPEPLLPPRKNMIQKGKNGYKFNFLNHIEVQENKINWKLNLANTNFRLWLMNLHYMEFLEEVDDKDFINLIENWIDSNKIFEKHFDWAAWNSYSLSVRTLVWMQQFSRRGINLGLPRYKRIKESLFLQIIFLERNIENDIGGNHLIKNIKTLLWASRFFSGNSSVRWKNISIQLLVSELKEQILPDGMHFELSTAYHCQVFIDLIECYSVLDDSFEKSVLFTKLHKMAQVINDITHPDGLISVFNDGSVDMSYPVKECLDAWERISGMRTETNQHFKLDSSGYYGFRTKDLYFIIDAGKVGPDHLPAHSHGDIFSFELSVGNERIIIDPGVFEYNIGNKRNYSRATSSHNTLSLNNEDQCEFYGSFRVAKRAQVKIQKYVADKNGFELIGIHDGYKRLAGSPLHQRKFAVEKNKIEIADEVIGGDGQLATASLLLHPECEVVSSVNGIQIKKNGKVISVHSSGEIKIVSAYYFPEFGKSVLTKKIIIQYGNAPCKGAFQIIPLSQPSKPVFRNIPELHLAQN